MKTIPFVAATRMHRQQHWPPAPVYQRSCAKCHGKTGKGRILAGPSLVSEKVTAISRDELHDIIRNGKHRMPKFEGKLQPLEIDALVQQIQSQSNGK